MVTKVTVATVFTKVKNAQWLLWSCKRSTIISCLLKYYLHECHISEI
jgi:hypothetical protein